MASVPKLTPAPAAPQHLTRTHSAITKAARSALKGQRPCLLWFTGYSGAGKSTIAEALDERLYGMYQHAYVLDGDNVRHGLSRDLGFSNEDRAENIRRIGEVSKLLVDAGIIVISAFISPFRADRDTVRALFPEGEFFEVFINAPLSVCEQRDPKGLYKKARAGGVSHFTGVDSGYEPPLQPEVELRTNERSVDECVDELINLLKAHGCVRSF